MTNRDYEELMIDGRATRVTRTTIGTQKIVFAGNLVKLARIEEEEYEDVEDPEPIIETLRRTARKPDIFTFVQRLPETKPKYSYYRESESIAAISIKTYDHWWNNQVNSKTRNLVRKAEKTGVTVRQVEFSDDFIHGMMDIFNETPVRQGRQFWHYGKDFETIKKQFSRNLFREDLFGAYYNGTLIGFIFLAYAGKYATLGQIVSKIEHRDKAPNNALIAKAVKVCETKNIPYLVYAMWTEGSLGDFKRHNGFEKIELPRYYCPLTVKGKIVLKLNLHHGLRGILPEKLKAGLKLVRKRWHGRKSLNA